MCCRFIAPGHFNVLLHDLFIDEVPMIHWIKRILSKSKSTKKWMVGEFIYVDNGKSIHVIAPDDYYEPVDGYPASIGEGALREMQRMLKQYDIPNLKEHHSLDGEIILRIWNVSLGNPIVTIIRQFGEQNSACWYGPRGKIELFPQSEWKSLWDEFDKNNILWIT